MERLSPGSQITGIPGATWNEFCDTKKQVDQLTKVTNQLGSRGTSALRVQVVNTTGDDIVATFPVLKIGDPVTKSSDRENCVHEGIQFTGETPDDDTTRFAIVQSPIPDGAFRSGVFEGLSWCRLNVSDITHTKAKPTTTSDYLVSSLSGAPVLWRELQDEADPDDQLGEQYAIVLLGGGDEETYRLIRGESVGIQSGTTILIDVVVPLADGLDPTAGDGSVQISVYNTFGQTFADNELIDAAYNAGVATDTDWETLKSTGEEKYRLIEGRVTATVTADMGTFDIDTVIPLANGNNPVSSPSDTIEVVNANGDTFEEDQQIVAIWFDAGIESGWSTLLTERYRLISGTVYTTGSPLHCKNIQPLAAGRDPRTDPTNIDEIVDVTDYLSQSWTAGDIIYAVWNAATLTWEALPKVGRSSGSIFTALPDAPISQGSASAPTSGTGEVFSVGDDGSTTSMGTGLTLRNPFCFAVTTSCTVSPLGESYLIVGVEPPIVCTTKTVVTDVACELNEDTGENEIAKTTEDITYVSEPCS